MELRGVQNKKTLDTVNEGVKLRGFASRELVFIALFFLMSFLVVFFLSKVFGLIYLGVFIWAFLKVSNYFKAAHKKGITSPLLYLLNGLNKKTAIVQEDDTIDLLKFYKDEQDY